MGTDAQPHPGLAQGIHIQAVEILLTHVHAVSAHLQGQCPVVVDEELCARCCPRQRNRLGHLRRKRGFLWILDAQLHGANACCQYTAHPLSAVDHRIHAERGVLQYRERSGFRLDALVADSVRESACRFQMRQHCGIGSTVAARLQGLCGGNQVGMGGGSGVDGGHCQSHNNMGWPATGVEATAMSCLDMTPASNARRPDSIPSLKARAMRTGSSAWATAEFNSTPSSPISMA